MKTYKINTHTYVEEISASTYSVIKRTALAFEIESYIADIYGDTETTFEKRYFVVKANDKCASRYIFFNKTAIAETIRKIARAMDVKAINSAPYYCISNVRISCNVPSLVY